MMALTQDGNGPSKAKKNAVIGGFLGGAVLGGFAGYYAYEE
jgi:hypothetical protein